MKSKTMTLEQFADFMNAADLCELEVDDISDIIVANGWIPSFDEWQICHDGKQMIYFDDKGIAKVTSIEELEIKQIDRDFKLFQMIEELERSERLVRERKISARAAEIKLKEKYEIEELESVLPHRKVIATDFDNKNLYLENGECVSGEFPRQGKIYDNVEYCTDTKRFEFLEYFLKEDEEE